MSAGGYSGPSLVHKTGIKPGSRILLVDTPLSYFELPGTHITEPLCMPGELPDIVHLFAITRIKGNVIIWLSWYKKDSKIPTDITEDTMRDYALNHELVDVKVCAVDNLWSGLKLVVPFANRKK
ncbi:MAG: DUF3052 domain-containing protein [Chitinophagaceae bacterium]|nr:MAG: DUF3052 domain-containing protein [Chitinophagaceae bacterium]